MKLILNTLLITELQKFHHKVTSHDNSFQLQHDSSNPCFHYSLHQVAGICSGVIPDDMAQKYN